MKKATSKVTAWLLAMLMIVGALFATSSTVLASNEGTLNIHKLSSTGIPTGTGTGTAYWTDAAGTTDYEYLAGATYTIYKIGTFSQTTTPGTPGSAGLTYTPLTGLQDTSGAAITALNASTNPDTINVSTATLVDSATTSGSGVLTFSTGLDKDGVYLVKETVTPVGVSTATNFIVTVPMYVNGTWTNTINAYPKNSTTDLTVAKEITSTHVADGSGKKTVNVGDTVSYQIDVNVPRDIATAGYTKFNIIDTSGKALTIDTTTGGFPGTVVVEDNGTALTYGTDYTVTYNTTGATSNILTISFYDGTGAALYTLTAGNAITVTYDATIGSGTSMITNKATVEYTTPGGTGTEEDDDDDDNTVYTYSYALKKVDESAAALTGAKFVMSVYLDASGNMVPKGTAGATLNYLTRNATTGAWGYTTTLSSAYEVTSTGADALAAFEGLQYGTSYYLVETAAPATYTLLIDDINVTIDANTTATAATTGGYSIQVVNKLESSIIGALPSTGGNGIYLYLILGGILIAAGSVLYVKTRKKNPTA